MVSLVEQNIIDDDFLGDFLAVKNCIVPAKGTVRIKCKVKGDVKGLDLSFVCAAPLTGDWDESLEVTEALGELKRGRTPHVNIELTNTSGKDIHTSKNMIVGEYSSVSAVIPLNIVKPDSDVANISSVGTGESPAKTENEKWQPKAKLGHLSKEEQKEIEELLWEECDVFAKDDCDIGEIPDFQMGIHLTDEIPVNECYRHLPRKLYDDVKTYVNDLIINGWVRESTSAYASPIVCVRKKDNSLRLCVDYRLLNFHFFLISV